jgi:hypothetical protein
LGGVAAINGLLKRFGQCFTDYRDSRYIEHTVEGAGLALLERRGE